MDGPRPVEINQALVAYGVHFSGTFNALRREATLNVLLPTDICNGLRKVRLEDPLYSGRMVIVSSSNRVDI